MRKDRGILQSCFFIMLSILLASCGSGGSSSGGKKNKAPLVRPLYVLNGADWNDYVADDGGDIFSASDTACDPSTDNSCLHGGELRVLKVPGYASCTGLSAADDLGAFDWTCVVMDFSAYMVSTGLKDGKHLSDLLDFGLNKWRPNRVVVSDTGVPFLDSGESAWWSNPVKLDNDGSNGSDMSAGDIIIVTADAGASYVIGADRVGLVIKPGVTLSGPDAASTVVSAISRAFLWMEGTIGAPAGRGVSLEGTYFSVLRGLHVSESQNEGILISNSELNTISDAAVSNNLDGIALYNSSGNMLKDITAHSNILNGITFEGASDNAISNYTGSENGGAGLWMKNSSNNSVSDLTASLNMGAVVMVNSSDGNSFDNISALKNEYGIILAFGPQNNALRHMSIINSSEDPMFLAEADYNVIEDLKVIDGNYGIELLRSAGNYLKDIVVTNNFAGIALVSNAQNNIIDNYTAFNNDYGSLSLLDNCINNVFQNITVVNNDSGAIGSVLQSTNNVFINVSVANNSHGLSFNGSSGNSFENLAIADQEYGGIGITDSSNNAFTGLLKVGNNGLSNCSVNGGTNPGLVNTTCTETGLDGSNTYGVGNTSDATLTTGVTMASSFVGKVISDDTANSSDTDGLAAYDDITDWANFENLYRGWGLDGNAFPDATNRGRCVSGGDCRIWDWSLRASDGAVRGVLSLPTGNDVITHTWSDLSTTMFLRNAVEIYGDGIGNDNGLCESDETCLYTPNIGSYQGDGNLVSAGTIGTGGTLENITLLQYENNGY